MTRQEDGHYRICGWPGCMYNTYGGQELEDNDNDKIRVNPLDRANALFRTTRALSYSNFFNLLSFLSSLVVFVIPSCELLSVWSRGWQLRKLEQQIQGQDIENIFNVLSWGQRQLSSVLLLNFFSSDIWWLFHGWRMRCSDLCTHTNASAIQLDGTHSHIYHSTTRYIMYHKKISKKVEILPSKICGLVWQNCSGVQR